MQVTAEEGAQPAAKPRRRLTQAEAKARTRRQLLEAAARVFAEKGYAGASLEEIAESAGYSTGALYYNFAGKQELFLELLDVGWTRGIDRRARAVARIFDEAAATGTDPFDALSRLVARRSQRQSEQANAPLAAEFWLYAVRNPDAMGLVAAKLGEEVGLMKPMIAAAMERLGAAPGLDASEMTVVAVLLFDALVRQRRIDPQSVSDDLFARVLRRLFAARDQTGRGTEHTVADDEGLAT
jgi:AcrR family transcriptional regulator